MASVTVDGVEFYFRQEGSGPDVLLIHGTGIDADTWIPISDELVAEHRVTAYDRRAFSRSAAEPVRDWVRHAEDAVGLMDALGIESATVAGWSAGGTIAAELAVRHPDRVAALALLEAAIGGKRAIDRRTLTAFAGSLVRRRLRGSEAGVERFMRWACTYDDGRCVWDEFPEERRRTILANGPGVWGEFGHADSLTDEQLASIRCPVLVAAGSKTQPWFARCAKRLVPKIESAELRSIEGANHALGFTAPEATAEVIREAAAKASAARAAAA